jgi:hypothetical protein
MGVTFGIIRRDFGIICRSACMPSGSTNDEAFPRRFHHLPCHLSQGVDLDEAGNLRQQTMQYAEVASRNPDDGRQYVVVL